MGTRPSSSICGGHRDPSASKLRTYGDVVEEYVRLNRTKARFAQIPHGRYINFMSDFLAAEKGATRRQAIQAWKKLKTLDVPKNYRSWVLLHRP